MSILFLRFLSTAQASKDLDYISQQNRCLWLSISDINGNMIIPFVFGLRSGSFFSWPNLVLSSWEGHHDPDPDLNHDPDPDPDYGRAILLIQDSSSLPSLSFFSSPPHVILVGKRTPLKEINIDIFCTFTISGLNVLVLSCSMRTEYGKWSVTLFSKWRSKEFHEPASIGVIEKTTRFKENRKQNIFLYTIHGGSSWDGGICGDGDVQG